MSALSRQTSRVDRQRWSDVEVCDIESIVLNELAPRLDHIAHQAGEDFIRDVGILEGVVDDGRDGLQMFAARQFRDDAAEDAVHVLGQDDE